MLPLKKHIILAISLLAVSIPSFAQFEVKGFTAIENKGKVQLAWIMTEGSICNGIVVLRSTDSINFERVGAIAGTCGKISEPETFTFIDPSPIVNRKSYYQLEFGGLTYSAAVSIEVYDISSGSIVIPNPAVNNTNIHFSNTDNSEHTLKLYYQGKQVAELTTKEDEFNIDLTDYKIGIYHYYIIHEKKGIITQGTVVKSH